MMRYTSIRRIKFIITREQKIVFFGRYIIEKLVWFSVSMKKISSPKNRLKKKLLKNRKNK